MESEERKYLNEVLYLIWDYIAEESHELSKQILTEEQRDNLADISLFQADFKVIYDYFYVVDRFCNTKIFPRKHEIKYSTKFNREKLSEKECENLDSIISILNCGDNKTFGELNKFYPKSSEKYISKPYSSLEYRYNVDFSGSIWGIKHLHLKERQRGDNLLYYAIIENNIYFIGIGSHDDMYNKDNLEVVVNEFKNILPHLGIGHYQDIPFDNFENLSKDEVMQNWKNGRNIGFFINEKYYVSSNLMAGSKIKANLNYEIRNVSYQIENQSKEFVQSLMKGAKIKSDLEIRLDEYKDLSKNELLIKEESQKIAQYFYINYLTILNQTKILVGIYCN
jgi:hypothetical protein